MSDPARLRGLVFAKQFPNAAEPARGVFNAVQVAATSDAVDWRVIAPVPWAPPWPPLTGRPRVPLDEVRGGVPVSHPRFLLPPRHLGYMRVAGWMAAASAAAFNAAVREHAPQFVHAHALYPSAAAAAQLASRAGLPLVVTVHGSDLYTLAGRPEWRARIAAVAQAARAVVCVSDSLARDVVALLGIDGARITVVPDAYDDGRFTYVCRPLPAGRSVRVVSVARLVDVKGPDVLVEAVGRLVADGEDVDLTIIGHGVLRASLLERARVLGIAERVRLLGGVPSVRLPEILAAADVYVQPSRREGFGVALVEALATGLPAVATRSGGPESIVTEADGVLVEPGDPDALADALRDVIGRLGSFDAAGIAARASARFSRAIVGARLVEVYRRAIGSAAS